MNTKRLTKLMALVLVMVMCLSVLTACPKKTGEDDFVCPEDPNPVYTYQTYTAVSPSNWNELTYQYNNDSQIMSYIGSSFFTFDFKFDEAGNILPGEFVVKYDAATKLEDVTVKYAVEWLGVTEDELAEMIEAGEVPTGYAYAITLRNDLKWENGDPIKAEDFVYSMQQQLDPLFQNYRADSYYNSAQSLVGAKLYAKQGQPGWVAATEYDGNDANYIFTLSKEGEAPVKGGLVVLEETLFRQYFGFTDALYPLKNTISNLVGNASAYGIDATKFTAAAATKMEGMTLADIKADPELNAAWEEISGWWAANGGEASHLLAVAGQYGEYSWDDVGIFVGDNEYELVIVLEKALDLLKDDGSLDYKAAYNMASLPLVHKATYEANKVAPQEGSELWTSTYNSSQETTMSWGPYKLTEFQSGKYYKVERNDQWYGYNMPENEGLYQTDVVYCETISEWNTAWLKFLAGEIEGIGIDVSIAADYKNSERAYYTPDDYVGSMQLQSSKAALENRESEGINKTLLTYVEFRNAISLAIDRADYNNKCTTASLKGFGLFNSMHYYDVANGGVFRNTDEAKKVLCEVYSVDWTQYPTLDDAVAAITGYNLAKARELVTTAYNKALADGEIDGDDIVKLTFGTSVLNESTQRQYNYLSTALKTMVVGTPLEGRLEAELKEFGDAWANDFRAGAYDICTGGWSGAAWDPGYFLLAYLDPAYMYSQAWDTSSEMMTFTMVGVGENGEDITEEMSLLDWYACLNGDKSAKYDWSSNALEESQRLQLIAALEKAVLKQYYTVPIQNYFSASLLSYKVDYITYDYNTFMGYGGMKYMTYNYSDMQWKALVDYYNGQIEYK